MGKEFRDGLHIENSCVIINEKKPGFCISERLIQILAVIIGSWSTVSIFIESLAIPVNINYVNLALLICAGAFFVLFLISSYDLVNLFFIFLFYGLYLFSRLSGIKNGFYIIENLVIDRLVSCYKFSGYYFIADYSSKTTDTTLLVIMFMLPFILLLTLAIVKNKLVNICSLVLFLPVSLSFLMGVIPSEKLLITYILSVTYLTRSGFPYHNKKDKNQFTLLHRINSRVAVWMSLMALFIFLMIRILFPVDKYENIKELDTMQTKVQKTFTEISMEEISDIINNYTMFDSKATVGGLNGGSLGKNNEIKYTGSKQLLVSAPYTSVAGGIYLKGYVGSTYTGDRWEGASKEDSDLYNKLMKNVPMEQFSPVNQTNLFLNGLLVNSKSDITVKDDSIITLDIINYLYNICQGTMKVQYKAANKKYIYAPYYTNYDLLSNVYYDEDLYAAPKVKQDSYEFNYYFNPVISDTGYSLLLKANTDSNLRNYSKYEKLYRTYVNNVYTKLPAKGLERLKKDFSVANLPDIITDTTMKVDYVRNYLKQNTKYSLSPGKLPKGKDFVEYFLYENKKGYCAHYASAATLMLRAMDVPARYVEGYAVSPSQVVQNNNDSKQMVSTYSDMGIVKRNVTLVDINVTDRNAHAWVEVYMDGCGWVPVDFTPASGMDYNTALITDFSKAKKYMKSEEATPTEKPEKPTPAVNQKKDTQSKKSDEQASKSNLINLDKVSKWNNIFIRAFIVLCLLTLISMIFIRLRKRRKIRNTRDNKKRVIFLFKEIEKTLSLCKHGLPFKHAELEDCEEYVRNRSPYIDTKVFIRCMEIIKKARFSNDCITLDEAMEVEAFYHKLYRDVYEELSSVKRFYMKIIILFK